MPSPTCASTGRRRLVIGVEPGAPLDDLVTGFHAAFPEIEVIVRVVSFATELSAIRDGDVDVGFLFPLTASRP